MNNLIQPSCVQNRNEIAGVSLKRGKHKHTLITPYMSMNASLLFLCGNGF